MSHYRFTCFYFVRTLSFWVILTRSPVPIWFLCMNSNEIKHRVGAALICCAALTSSVMMMCLENPSFSVQIFFFLQTLQQVETQTSLGCGTVLLPKALLLLI